MQTKRLDYELLVIIHEAPKLPQADFELFKIVAQSLAGSARVAAIIRIIEQLRPKLIEMKS